MAGGSGAQLKQDTEDEREKKKKLEDMKPVLAKWLKLKQRS